MAFYSIVGRAALQKRIMALLRQLDRQTAGNIQVQHFKCECESHIGICIQDIILLTKKAEQKNLTRNRTVIDLCDSNAVSGDCCVDLFYFVTGLGKYLLKMAEVNL